MSQKVTVVCPHCGSTGTHQVGVSNGSSGAQCNQCHKIFRIYMSGGAVNAVKKS
jgi:transposase-like protein